MMIHIITSTRPVMCFLCFFVIIVTLSLVVFIDAVHVRVDSIVLFSKTVIC